MKISNEVKVLLGLGVIVLVARYLNMMSKKNFQVASTPAPKEEKKGFMNLTASNSAVIGGVQYTCPVGQEVLEDGSGVVGCYTMNPDGELEYQGRPKKSRNVVSSPIGI